MKYYLSQDEIEELTGEDFDNIWTKLGSDYIREFSKLSSRLPEDFILEYSKVRFHDNSVLEIIVSNKRKEFCDITLLLKDFFDSKVLHHVELYCVHKFKAEWQIDEWGIFDWIYSEILPVNDDVISLEAIFDGEKTLYIEFEKLKYRKSKVE